MSERVWPGNNFGPTVERGLLAVGDVLSISAFVLIGMIHHGIDPLDNPAHVIGATAPFLLGWGVVASVLGLYSQPASASFRTVTGRTLSAWVVGAAIALGIRTTPYFPGDSPPTFVVVTLVVGGTFLLMWRLTMTAVRE